ncbi:hypothetical protein ACROYT_G018736 [Oculina patagonica]
MDSILEPITETDEQKFCVEMMKRLAAQRRNDHFCDVILEVGSGDDQARLKAHRIVLCAASPFFYNALNSDMKEKKEGVIRLKETSKAVMEEVLEYLYTGHVDINEHNAFDLLATADYFIIPSLKALCSEVILQALSFSNCITAYYLAVKYGCKELMKHARDFILANFVAVAETEDFLNLSSKQVEEWISIMNDLDCSKLASDAMKMVFSGEEDCYFAQSPRNCLKTHEDAIVACAVKTTLCYIPSESKWYQLADMLSTVKFSGQCYSSCHGKLYRVGGNTNGYTAERYDPLVNSWFPLKSFQQTIKFCAVTTFQGFVYVIGGVSEEDIPLSTVQRYNPDTNLWQAMPSLSSPRSSVCAVADENHLYAIGGKSEGASVDIAERFDPKEKSWSRIASTLEKRRGAGGAAVNQKVFVFGGLKDEAPDAKACEMYDPTTNTWSVITSVVALQGSASAVSFKGKVFVYGEFKEGESRGKLLLQVFDTVSNEWTPFTIDGLQALGKLKISSLRIPREVLDTCVLLIP